tara:strand:+ start:563 stop:772 length:210 start_codon:yes stop_codon:yes gene_type:complete
VPGVDHYRSTFEVPIAELDQLAVFVSGRLVFYKPLGFDVLDPNFVVVWISSHFKAQLHEVFEDLFIRAP